MSNHQIVNGVLVKPAGSISAGITWMIMLSVFLFWLPVVGPAVAGFVGGKRAGSVGGAIAAVFLPAILFGGLLFALATSMSGLPLIGAVAGIGGMALSLIHIGPLLVGAIVGGAMA
ncbi:MAG: hypothetical protein ACT4OZ_04790 [Gemmatimonadota bacterium]